MRRTRSSNPADLRVRWLACQLIESDQPQLLHICMLMQCDLIGPWVLLIRDADMSVFVQILGELRNPLCVREFLSGHVSPIQI